MLVIVIFMHLWELCLLLGIKIVDGINVLKSVCGIFVKEVLPGSLAERDGKLS